jgi:D-alanine-D-alanine ligase-like ATP-grasp enzyme
VTLAEKRYALTARLDLLRLVGPRLMWRRRDASRRFDDFVNEHSEHVIAQMWEEGAAASGVQMERLAPTLFEFRRGQATTRISLCTTRVHDLVSTRLAEDKPLAYRILVEAGIPVPDHTVVDADDLGSARAFFERFPPPFVVKPVSGGGGTGVVGEIHDFAQLRRALVHTRRLGPRALIERQLDGDSYRLLFLEGELLDVLRRARPRVTGDGVSTIEQLISREHERRIAAGPASGLKPFIVDLDSVYSIRRSGYELRSVLPAGVSVVVKTATNFNARGEIAEGGELPESTIDTARRSADALGCRLAGVDLVLTDPSGAFAETGAVLEVEPVPGLWHHYRADGTGGLRVTVPILNALLRESPSG